MASVTIKGEVTDPRINIMIDHLVETYPIDKDIVIQLEHKDLLDNLPRPGAATGAMLTMSSGPVVLRVATKLVPERRGIRSILKTIAHEYRHAIQRFRDGRAPNRGNRSYDLEMECDALTFACYELEALVNAGRIHIE